MDLKSFRFLAYLKRIRALFAKKKESKIANAQKMKLIKIDIS